MIEVDATATTVSGVAFVSATVWNTRATPQRVRLRSAVPGPTWSPRGGSRRTGWSDDEWTARLEPGRRRGFGFATPVSEPIDDAATVERTLVSEESADPTDRRTDRRTDARTDRRTDLEAALASPVELVSAERAGCEDGPTRPEDVLASLAAWAPVGAILEGGSSSNFDAAHDSEPDHGSGLDHGPGTAADLETTNRPRAAHHPRDPPER